MARIEVISKVIAQMVSQAMVDVNKRIDKLTGYDDAALRKDLGNLLDDRDKTIEAQQDTIESQSKTIKTLRLEYTSLAERVKKLEDVPLPEKGEKGDKGDKGDQGEDGANASKADVASYLLGDKQFSDLILDLLPEPVPGKDGKDGENGEKGDTPEIDYDHIIEAAANKAGATLPNVTKIREWVEEKLPDLIPDPIPGEKGEKGDKGDVAQVDMAQIVKEILERSRFKELLEDACLEGPRGDKGDAGEVGPPPTQGQVDAALEKFIPQLQVELARKLTQIGHKGVYKPDEVYFPGDEVIKNNSSFRAKRETSQAPPGDDWQCISKSQVGRRGPIGEKGETGEKGDAAPHILEGVMTEDLLVLTFSDGTALDIEIEKPEPTEDE